MKVSIKVKADTPKKILRELRGIVSSIKEEINDPICRDCTDCKDKSKGCFVGGGVSEPGLESNWKIVRSYNEHKTICKSEVK